MLKVADHHWSRWVDALAARLRPVEPATVASAVADEPSPAICTYCGHALPEDLSDLPRCTLCGDGDSSLALYSQHALNRTAFAIRH